MICNLIETQIAISLSLAAEFRIRMVIQLKEQNIYF